MTNVLFLTIPRDMPVQQLREQQRPVGQDGHDAQRHVVGAGDDVAAPSSSTTTTTLPADTASSPSAEDDPVYGPGVVGEDGGEAETPVPVAALVEVDAPVAEAHRHQGLPGGDAGEVRGGEGLREAVDPPVNYSMQ